MTAYAAKMAREEAFDTALRLVSDATEGEEPSHQILRAIALIKAKKSDRPLIIPPAAPKQNRDRDPVDYLSRVQHAAQIAWRAKHGSISLDATGPEHDAVAGLETPIGYLKTITWRRAWRGDARGERIAWASEYYLDDEPITVAEIKAAGLAQRPTTRNRKRKGPAA